MAQIHNSETIRRILDDAGIQTSIDAVPNQLARSVVPVLNANPERICNVVENTTTSSTIYTCPTDKDFFLVSAWVSASGGVGDDNSRISVVVNGAIKLLVRCYCNTGQNSISVGLSKPLKLTRGSAITFTLDNSAGSGGIIGYTVETSKR